MSNTPTVDDVSGRLLRSADKHSRDPKTEIDWDAPVSDQFGLVPETSTLYGTPLWESMTHEERTRLTRYEMASVMQTGIWFEMILQEILLREQYRGRYHGHEFQWTIQEIMEECSHTLMFARASEKLAGRTFRPDRLTMEMGRLHKNVAFGAIGYAGILIAEEVLDIAQRAAMRDDRVDPLVRKTSEIHVFEEARHISFARAEMREDMARHTSAAYRIPASISTALTAQVILGSLVSPEVYSAAGLDTREAVRQARANPNFQQWLLGASEKLIAFIEEVGLAHPISHGLYRAAGIMP